MVVATNSVTSTQGANAGFVVAYRSGSSAHTQEAVFSNVLVTALSDSGGNLKVEEDEEEEEEEEEARDEAVDCDMLRQMKQNTLTLLIDV